MESTRQIIEAVRHIVQENLSWTDLERFGIKGVSDLLGGKMLRSRLAARLCPDVPAVAKTDIIYACAAVELIHTASLFHDDVIDGATLRRGRPTLWKEYSPNCSILIGDMLFCEALKILSTFCIGRMSDFVKKVHEVCAAESRQELILRGSPNDEETSLQIARGKTGALFAFVAASCGGSNQLLCAALEEAGYLLGTAYQLADDLIDEKGTEDTSGKTLGTDRLRNKFTLVNSSVAGSSAISGHILSLYHSALQVLEPWPAYHCSVQQFFEIEVNSTLAQILGTS